MVKSTQLSELSRSRAKKNRKAVNEVSQHPAQKNRKNIRKEKKEKMNCAPFFFIRFVTKLIVLRKNSNSRIMT